MGSLLIFKGIISEGNIRYMYTALYTKVFINGEKLKTISIVGEC